LQFKLDSVAAEAGPICPVMQECLLPELSTEKERNRKRKRKRKRKIERERERERERREKVTTAL
jgi:hypothetical protein